MTEAIALHPRVSYPRQARAGGKYVVSVDLDHRLSPDEWPYDREEYPVTCFLDAAPHFVQEVAGDPTVVVHRFGGSYGPARFWLTAGKPAVAAIRLTLVNGAGTPILTRTLDDIEIVEGRAPQLVTVADDDVVSVPGRATAESRPAAGTFRWLHLGDLQFQRPRRRGRNDTETYPRWPALVADVRRIVEQSPIDAIIVTGDLATAGREEELEAAYESLDALRREFADAFGRSPAVLTVPGNHDADLETLGDKSVVRRWDSDPVRLARFWSDATDPLRMHVTRLFARYERYWRSAGPAGSVRGLLPGDFAVTLHTGGIRVGVVGLNDAFLGDPRDNRGGRADLEQAQLQAVCGDVREWALAHDLRVLLTHHHPSALPAEMGERFYRGLAPRWLFDLRLYGATHRQKAPMEAVETPSGLSIGGNASRWQGERGQGYRIGEARLSDRGLSVRMWSRLARGSRVVADPAGATGSDGVAVIEAGHRGAAAATDPQPGADAGNEPKIVVGGDAALPSVARRPRSRPPADEPAGYDPAFLGGWLFPLPKFSARAPSGSAVVPLHYEHFTIVMSLRRRFACFAAVNVDRERQVRVPRSADHWALDERIKPDEQVGDRFYAKSRLGRSRLVGRLQPAWGGRSAANRAATATNTYTNVVPLVRPLTEHRLWVDLPELIADTFAFGRRMVMFAGPVFNTDDPAVAGVQVPRAHWRIAVFQRADQTAVSMAFLAVQSIEMQRQSIDGPSDFYHVRVADVEKLTGLDFGPLVDADRANGDRLPAAGKVLRIDARPIRRLSEVVEHFDASTMPSLKQAETDNAAAVIEAPAVTIDVASRQASSRRDAGYWFYVSHAHSNGDEDLRQFVQDLVAEVRSLTGTDVEAFFDQHSVAGEAPFAVAAALARSRVMVAIISPAYINSKWCGQEWQYFAGSDPLFGPRRPILPVIWIPPTGELPDAVARLQLTGQGSPPSYREKGLRYMARRQRHRDHYYETLHQLAELLISNGKAVSPSDEKALDNLPDFTTLPNAFEKSPPNWASGVSASEGVSTDGSNASALHLSVSERVTLAEAITQAFPTPNDLQALLLRLDKHLSETTNASSYHAMVRRVVGIAQAEGWIGNLLSEARASRPRNAKLAAAVRQLLNYRPDSGPNLERTLQLQDGIFDAGAWRSPLAGIAAQVCRIEGPDGWSIGTGFLVGRDLVMTAFNVVEQFLSSGGTDLTCRFDYRTLSDGTVSKGTTWRLSAAEWLVDFSPYHAADSLPYPSDKEPDADHLDYAILRLAAAAGEAPIGAAGEGEFVPVRGWILLADTDASLEPRSPVAIVQHPHGRALQVAFQHDGLVGLNASRTRVWYRTSTLPGSSGAPCFSGNWELIAMHHAARSDKNEGIPIQAIAARLRRNGVILGGEQPA